VSGHSVQYLVPARVVRFWVSWQAGSGAYLGWRDEQFADESVATLYEQALAHQAALPADSRIRG